MVSRGLHDFFTCFKAFTSTSSLFLNIASYSIVLGKTITLQSTSNLALSPSERRSNLLALDHWDREEEGLMKDTQPGWEEKESCFTHFLSFPNDL